jgi:hypothetical protein
MNTDALVLPNTDMSMSCRIPIRATLFPLPTTTTAITPGRVQGPMGPEEDPYLVGALRFQENSQSVLDSDDTIHRCFIKTILRVVVSGQQEGQTIHV